MGSHFVRAARERNLAVIVLDDLSTGHATAVPSDVTLLRCDIGDMQLVARALRDHKVTAVVHFAGLIQVGESVQKPAKYFDVNVSRSLALLECVLREGVGSFVFSSSASVYAASDEALREDSALAPVSPYGMSKLAIEHALRAYGNAYGLKWAALRYFNAAGAHPDGTLRETHHPETHLIPNALDAAFGKTPPLTVFGNDYPTEDGTCIRDYVHVCDLADAHIAALRVLASDQTVGVVNLGSEHGFSVREVLHACELVLGRSVPHTFGARRAGDSPRLVADAGLAHRALGWLPQRSSLMNIVDDAARSRGTRER